MDKGAASNEVQSLKLPDLGDERAVGGRWVYRAVSLTFVAFVLFGGIGLLVVAIVSVDVTVDSNGLLEPATIWPIRTYEAGTIRSVLVETGDSVVEGQTLVQLDSLQLAGALAQHKSELRARELELQEARSIAPIEQRQQAELEAQAEARLVRARAMLRQRIVEYGPNVEFDSILMQYQIGKHVEIDVALSDVMAAEAELRSVRAVGDRLRLQSLKMQQHRAALQQIESQITTTRERLQRLAIVAPASGVVLTDALERLPGAFVREGDLLLEIADVNTWRVDLLVEERDVHKVRVGDPVRVEVRAFDSAGRELLHGRVVTVGSESFPTGGESGEGTRVGAFRVIAELDRKQIERMGIERLRRGYSVRSKIIISRGRILTQLRDYFQSRITGN